MSMVCLVLESHKQLIYYLYGIANRTFGCEWEILALMGSRHLISPMWLKRCNGSLSRSRDWHVTQWEAALAGTVGMAEHSMPIGELGGKSACQRIFGIIGLAKLASTSVLAVITSAEKVIPLTRSFCSTLLFEGQYAYGWRCCYKQPGGPAVHRKCAMHLRQV